MNKFIDPKKSTNLSSIPRLLIGNDRNKSRNYSIFSETMDISESSGFVSTSTVHSNNISIDQNHNKSEKYNKVKEEDDDQPYSYKVAPYEISKSITESKVHLPISLTDKKLIEELQRFNLDGSTKDTSNHVNDPQNSNFFSRKSIKYDELKMKARKFSLRKNLSSTKIRNTITEKIDETVQVKQRVRQTNFSRKSIGDDRPSQFNNRRRRNTFYSKSISMGNLKAQTLCGVKKNMVGEGVEEDQIWLD